MRDIKFMAWHVCEQRIFTVTKINFLSGGVWSDQESIHVMCGENKDCCVLMQFTGLKDKNGLDDIYEGDIIGVDGLKKGNVYENRSLLEEKSNLIIQGLGTSSWEATNKKAMERGCRYSE